MADLYPRTWPERLADIAPFFGLLAAINGYHWLPEHDSLWVLSIALLVSVVLTATGVERGARYQRQRDTYRRSLVALLAKVGEDQAPAYYADLVPADVLTEAFEEANRA